LLVTGPCPAIPEHLRGFDYTGPNRYFLTLCTHQRALYFVEGQHVALVSEQFQRASREQAFAVIAYCFMPDHVHLLVAGERDDADLKRFMKYAKQYSGFNFRQLTGLFLWQRYGYERVLRNEETTPAVARYTIANPVRAGIVRAPADDPFWGSLVYTREALLEYIQRAT
jgi:REP-associated tyrosine transposase